jgi:hypothetical protein
MIKFSEGFADLPTASYRAIVGKGFGIAETKPSFKLR